MKKILTFGLMSFGIAGIVLGFSLNHIQKVKDNENSNEESFNKQEKTNERIYLNSISSLDFNLDVTDLDYLEENSSDIIIGKVKSIDGTTNYNEKNKSYTFVSTYGTIQVEGIIKSNSKFSLNDTVLFARMGGEITVAEYEKSLEPRQIVRQKIDQLTEEEKKNLYVRMYIANDIEIEAGKTYLMYLSYDESTEKYAIIGFENGLREYNNINNTFKNNATGEFESLTYEITY